VARMEPSNTATEDVESVGPRTITRAICRARGVSRRSSKAALNRPGESGVSGHPGAVQRCRED
jgi:hypothetical protein